MELRTEIPGVYRSSVLRVPVDVLAEERFEEAVSAILDREIQCQIVLLRFPDLMRARRNKEYREILRNAGLVIPLSTSIVRGARFLLHTEPVTYMPFNFVVRLLSVLEKRGASLYLLGLDRKDMETVEQNVRQTFPGLRLVGRYHGFYPKYLEESIVTAIKKAGPSCLLVGSGVGDGTRWLYRYRHRFHPGIQLWAPEVLDIFADRRKRPSRKKSERTLRTIGTLLRHPWRVLRVLLYCWYGLLLLIFRLFRLS